MEKEPGEFTSSRFLNEPVTQLLLKYDVNYTTIMCVRAQSETHKISIEEYIKTYKVRDMLKWRNLGMKKVYAIAEALEKEGYCLFF
ncbi:hypothetical protein [Mucilaginibacter arboris]|uniref:RNA polymerase alpha subunit C-terminal domain-containing protein n=1 Tax=Mucilaginibacter arboris TaxID=2682090 RepID=A0A7K1T079_9SPHI|nr:hypothetical protein [Mucilaginibacter arboris]MVN22972.1 hypothetical protein [Mucilaginibacter arboris]